MKEIKISNSAVDGFVESKTYKTIKGARKYLEKWAGSFYDVVGNVLITGDGINKLTVKGAKISEILTTKNEEKENMAKLKKGFVVGARDARLQMGNLRKAKEAVPAVKAVKAVPEKKDKDGNITQEAVAAVKAVPAKKAQPQVQQVHLDCVSEEVMHEVRARMADQGFEDKFDGQVIMSGNRFRLTFEAETAQPIRAAFKAVKAADGYNKEGMDKIKEQKKADAKAKKEAEKAEKEKAEKDKKAEKKEKFSEPKDEGDDGWPGEDFEE